MNPPPDLKKVGGPDDIASDDYSSWLVAAANMLASVGYGDGSTLSEKAGSIFTTLETQFGNKSGWVDTALK